MCRHSYEPERINVLRKGNAVTVVHAQCPRCKSLAILTILSGMLGMVTTMGMLTDMTREDIERFWEAQEITSDDVLQTHVSLEQVN